MSLPPALSVLRPRRGASPVDDIGPLLAHPLHPGLQAQVRADGSLQLGLDPVHGVVLTGLTEHEVAPAARLVELLVAASDPVLPGVLAQAVGLPEGRVADIVRTLSLAGLTRAGHPLGVGGELTAWALARRQNGPEVPDPCAAMLPAAGRREGARVVIDGRGDIVADLARILLEAGVGTVRSGWYAAADDDLDGEAPDPLLVVTVGTRTPRVRAMDWFRRSIAHLPVVARPGSVAIGPLVVPGTGPCLTCVRLDEGAALLWDIGRDDPLTDAQSDPVRVEPALAAVAAGAVAMLALGIVDGYPPPTGVRWHTALPQPSLATSRWEIHPQCGAHPRPATSEPATSGHGVTMAS